MSYDENKSSEVKADNPLTPKRDSSWMEALPIKRQPWDKPERASVDEAAMRCVECGHAPHPPGKCLNMASDSDCNCVPATAGERHEFIGPQAHEARPPSVCACGQPRSAPIHQQFQHSFVQPNPGWGKLCESCKFRSSNLDSDYPCLVFQEKSGTVFTRSDANVERLTPDGRDVTWAAKIGIDFTETCSAFTAREPAPPIHSNTLADGRVIDVDLLLNLAGRAALAGRTVSARLVSDLKKRLSRSVESGFSETRYAKANYSFPVIISPTKEVLDGRHRILKASDHKQIAMPVFEVTQAEIERCVIASVACAIDAAYLSCACGDGGKLRNLHCLLHGQWSVMPTKDGYYHWRHDATDSNPIILKLLNGGVFNSAPTGISLDHWINSQGGEFQGPIVPAVSVDHAASASDALEYINTVKLAAAGFTGEATAISRARVALDRKAVTPPTSNANGT